MYKWTITVDLVWTAPWGVSDRWPRKGSHIPDNEGEGSV